MKTRVEPVAQALGAATFQPRSKNPLRWKPNQARWIREQIKSGRSIFDIGSDVARASPSEFYQIEQSALQQAGLTRVPVEEVTAPVNGALQKFQLFEWLR